MKENEISYAIRQAIFSIYNKLGPGLFESVYEELLKYELQKRGFEVKQQVPLPLVYDSIKFDIGFRMDLVVNNKVIVEIKSVETIHEIHHKQLLTYLRLANMKLGILVNFNSSDMAKGIYRKVNGL